MPSWSYINEKYVLPARKLLLSGRAAQAEELLRQGVDESSDGWVMYQLAELLLFTTPDIAPRIDEACHLYAKSMTRLPNDGYRRLAEAALAKAKSMLTFAGAAPSTPKSLLPQADERPRARPAPVVVEEVPKPPDPLLVQLKERFGFDAFKPGQREVIEVLLKGRSALAVIPPGLGRSLCYEFPVLEGATLVVTSTPRADKDKLRFIAPEKISEVAAGTKVSLLVIDDAHCVSELSHDFRPAYLKLREAIARIKPASVLALSPTASPRVRADLVERLGLGNPFTHIGSFDRPNLVWSVVEGRGLDKAAALRQVLAEAQGPSVVFAGDGVEAERIVKQLHAIGIPSTAWHETLESRDEARELWRTGRKTVIAATPGFATLADRVDVRSVVHWQVPGSFEAYLGEAGIGGRDGKATQCVLLFDPEDKAVHRAAIDKVSPDRASVLLVLEAVTERFPFADILKLRDEAQVRVALSLLQRQGFITAKGPEEFERAADAPNVSRLDLTELERKRRQVEERISSMEHYAEARGCRRRELLQWFGERLAADWQCSGCDRCRKARDGGDDEYKAATLKAAVLDGVVHLEWKHVSVQEMSRAILFLGPAPVTRALKGKNEAEVRDLINALLRDGQLELEARGKWVKKRR